MKNIYPSFRVLSLFLALWLLPQLGHAQFYYGISQDYGKNRVQFIEFDWVFYRMQSYDVYFYRGNEDLAQQVVRMTDEELPKIEAYLDAPLDDRIQIMVFNNLSDLKQSNVNSSNEEDYNRSGVTRVSGRRIFIYFNGDYSDLRKHLRMGLSEAVISNLIYGSFTQSITNSTLLNLPAWYTEGMLSFIGERWSADIDRHVQNGFYTGTYRRINGLVREDARYAGHSFWYFVAQTYGDKVLRNILYMSVVNRDIESGFLYILGKDLEQMTQDWNRFYCNRYDLELIEEQYENEEELIKARKGHELVRMALSENSRYLAYVDQRFSRYKVYLYDFEEGKKQRILTGGYRIAQNTDYSYPLLAWNPNNRILAIFTEEEGFTKLAFYNIETDELQQKDFFRFDKVLSAQYSSDGESFVLSATQNGQSDIFIYNIRNTKITRVTNDDWDDLEPSFFDGDKRVAWSSNRRLDSLYPDEQVFDLPNRGNDLFATEAKALEQDSVKIWRLTHSPNVNETGVREYERGFLTFLSNRTEKQNQHLIKIDSAIAFVDTTTHYEYQFTEYLAAEEPLNIVDQAFARQRDKRYDLVLFDKRFRVYERPYVSPEDLNLLPINKAQPTADPADDSRAGTPEQELSRSAEIALYYPASKRSDFEIDITNYQFGEIKEQFRIEQLKELAEPDTGTVQPQTVQVLPRPAGSMATPEAETDEEAQLDIPPKRNYFLSFYQDEFNVRFDNMFDNQQYQPFTGVVSGNFLNQGFNMNFKVGVMDLMHDYRIIAGMRTTFQPLPGTSITPTAEFLVGVGDYKDRLDKIYTYRRRSQVQFLASNNYRRIITNQVEAKAVWPLSPVASVHGTVGYRIDENIGLARDFNRLSNPINYTDYALAKASYVYDNTRKLGLNLYAGLRYKVFTEYYRNLTISNSGLHTLGLDARNYTIIHRNMIWANRLAAGTSFGPEKLIHIMGGVDNDFSPDNDPSTPIARENNYVFQTLITNMRGFFQNARNGNHFAVVNTELRWPIVSYFANRPIRNDFINNLMVIGFTDVGTAWNGPSPYARENEINTREIPLGNNGLIVLDSQKEPIILGTGFGLRSRLFGYYVRADWAWGIEDGIVLPNVFYLSLSTDF